jgi:hypothetical protein
MNGCKGSEDIEIPGTVPVMVLEGATLFPRTLMPLYIFEPRYRAMLEEALATDRLVAIAQPLKGGGDQLCAVAGVGLIRACVKKEDGTSQLILQGVKRVSFTHWPQMLPFRIGAVQCFGRIESETQEQRNARLVHLQVILERGGIACAGRDGRTIGQDRRSRRFDGHRCIGPPQACGSTAGGAAGGGQYRQTGSASQFFEEKPFLKLFL